MRILIIHNYYKRPGGEDFVVDNEKTMLSKNGHQVFTMFKYNTIDLKSFLSKIRLIFRTHANKYSQKEVLSKIEEVQPDIVHVHNFFPLFSPSLFKACHDANVPVVLTLHNYRLLYPNGLMLKRNNELDHRTIKGSAFITIKDRVYRNSWLQTAVLAHFIEYNKKRNFWNKYVSQFICLTEFSKNIFEEWGLNPQKISVKPNFMEDKRILVDKCNDQFLFVGRLSQEKGILDLVHSWIEAKIKPDLSIIGDGPLADKIELLTRTVPNIHYLGKKSSNEVNEILANSRALVFPSIWYEGFPMTILEALCQGKPVVTTSIGSQSAIIKNGYNGLHYHIDDIVSLQTAVQIMGNDEKYEQMCKNARLSFQENFCESINYKQLMEVYRTALDN